MKNIFFISIFFVFVACHSNNNVEQNSSAVKIKASSSSVFDSSIHKIVGDYFALKKSFEWESDTMINFCSKQLLKDADSLDFSGFAADSVSVEQAKTNAQSISAEMQGLLGETKITDKQRGFYLLSEEMFDLLKLVHYKQQPVYKIQCATALDGADASWLSNSAEIKNPYQPKQNVACGKIVDTVKF